MSRGPQSVRLLVGEDDMNVSELVLTVVPGRAINVVVRTVITGGDSARDPNMRSLNVSTEDARAVAAAFELLAASGRSPT